MKNSLNIGSITDYSQILRTYGLEATPAGVYWQVGKTERTQGWILHLSVVVHQLQALLELVVPEFVARRLPFKIIMGLELAVKLIDGELGYIQLGKMVTIYPENNENAYGLAKDLIKLTSGFRGPAIPTDRCLGGVVYTRYGSFKPIKVNIGASEPIKCIYNISGELVADPYTIPFSLPKGIIWPFDDLATPELPGKPKLLNAKYFPLSVLKPDAKGSVIRALYFKKPWQISPCIIKQGHPYMFADSAGRDIRDRLQWQCNLYQDLKGEIPLAKVLDYFVVEGTAHLVMEFIKGIHLTYWIENIYRDRSWQYLSRKEKQMLLDKLLDILDIISRLHKRSYVHRDITPDNFLIDKKGHIFAVDLELAWSSQQHRPDPPFKLGTPGHMSPEQRSLKMPTVKEDIYGVGGMMVMIFANMHAIKFHLYPPEAIQNIIRFVTGEQLFGKLIAACLQSSPDYRPDLQKIRETLEHYRDEQLPETVIPDTFLLRPSMPANPERLVQMGISGLACPELLNPKQRWVSHVQKEDPYIGNEQRELTLSEGWHTGMTGVLWLVARASNMGFRVEACSLPYAQSWEYLLDHFFPKVHDKSPGLYTGSAGVAMAVVEAVNAGLLTMDESLQTRIQSCFLHKSLSLRLSDGLPGQGIALLNSSRHLDSRFIKDTLKGYIKDILARQLHDGSWNTINNKLSHQAGTFTGMDYGVAGIVWFLLCYFRWYPDKDVESAAKRALHWFSKICHKKSGRCAWPVSLGSKIRDPWQFSTGAPGIAHTFVRAYEIWGDPLYKMLAEGALSGLPSAPCRMDWSLSSGLAGLGEVYLEAAKAFNSNEWQKRSDWVAGLFLSSDICSDNLMVTWMPGYNTSATADLFTGNGGILHFCMRHLRPTKSSHPLSA
jgi:serine/threonine protein kinase